MDDDRETKAAEERSRQMAVLECMAARGGCVAAIDVDLLMVDGRSVWANGEERSAFLTTLIDRGDISWFKDPRDGLSTYSLTPAGWKVVGDANCAESSVDVDAPPDFDPDLYPELQRPLLRCCGVENRDDDPFDACDQKWMRREEFYLAGNWTGVKRGIALLAFPSEGECPKVAIVDAECFVGNFLPSLPFYWGQGEGGFRHLKVDAERITADGVRRLYVYSKPVDASAEPELCDIENEIEPAFSAGGRKWRYRTEIEVCRECGYSAVLATSDSGPCAAFVHTDQRYGEENDCWWRLRGATEETRGEWQLCAFIYMGPKDEPAKFTLYWDPID